ncbi:MAG: AAA family ATPase, partial [Epsilonproteobacteria bacterium]|nr:AAA family ATPase [Campylobacterota bacterium]
MKKLPIGISTFQKIIKDNYLYIDKTKEAYEIITNHTYLFLSRPRRFGKSLFLDTLKEIFQGNKELFEDLYIYDKWDWSQSYPVIKISFSGDMKTPQNLKNTILAILKDNQENLGVDCDKDNTYDNCFRELIRKTHQKYNKRVVILIDEYDKAMLDNLENMEIAKANREILRAFYGVIKDSDQHIKFVFLTGVSKFAKANIFSGLNNIRDITLLPRFGKICGYTQLDIETTFLPYLQGVDLEKLKLWYNGYNFLNDKVYNPFDILLFIDSDCQFDNYWFNTGTPSFLIKLFEKKLYNLAEFENLQVPKSLLNAFNIEEINLETVMFQSGYLTIKEVVQKRNRIEYILTYPNLETKMSFNDYLLDYFVRDHIRKNEVQNGLLDILEISDLDSLKEVLQSLFASIAYNNFTKNDIENYEGFYASVVYAYFEGAGFDKIVA